MKEVTLAASPRTGTGKGPARQNRAAGNIPAVVYGPEMDPQSVLVEEKALRAAIKRAEGISAIFDLEVNGSVRKVIIRDMQRDPITSRVVHIDFHAISMNKPLHITIPVKVIGTAAGVKEEGGILQTTLRELEVQCLPKDIPDDIEIDVSALKIGDSIHVGDITVANAKIITEPKRTIVVVAAPTIMKVETVEAEGEAVAEGEEGAEAEAAEGAEEKGEEKKEKKEKKE